MTSSALQKRLKASNGIKKMASMGSDTIQDKRFIARCGFSH